jgi:DNA-directed RNA polymerase specialized sigma24 family protein
VAAAAASQIETPDRAADGDRRPEPPPARSRDGRAEPRRGERAALLRETERDELWLRRFHQGDRATFDRLYRCHARALGRAITTLLGEADAETAVHEVFLRLLATPPLRESFRSGDIGAWLAIVCRNHALNFHHRRRREIPTSATPGSFEPRARTRPQRAADARLMVDRFRREALPRQWTAVFELRLLGDFSQSEAAAVLGIGRTTLAYQEAQLRCRLRQFLTGDPTDE